MKKYLLILVVLAIGACSQKNIQPQLFSKENFSAEIDGKTTSLYTLKNAGGVVTQITNFGGKVVNLWVPGKNGDLGDVVLGYSNIGDYQKTGEIYFGSLIGRYGNRIGQAQFQLNDTVYKLAANNGPNNLHGGVKGFNAVVWDAEQPDDRTLILKYLSPDGEEGFPGNLNVKVQYFLSDENELKIEYWATTDKPTPLNLTSHSFFNLKGEGAGTVNGHILQINADNYTPVDSTLIPFGEIVPVEGTPMDFRSLTAIGSRVGQDFEQLKMGNGYDHNWVLNQQAQELKFAAKVVEPESGRTMEVYTNEPGIQFYGGNFLTGKEIGKSGKAYNFRDALCLETQHYPNSPNQPEFPSTILQPGEEYYSICIYKFGVEK